MMTILIIFYTISLVLGLGILIHELFFDKCGLTLINLLIVIVCMIIPFIGTILLVALIVMIMEDEYQLTLKDVFRITYDTLSKLFNAPISFRKK
jgi:hypothetical protein